jgi:hypothetical protein
VGQAPLHTVLLLVQILLGMLEVIFARNVVLDGFVDRLDDLLRIGGL